jgi:hypothetical protein
MIELYVAGIGVWAPQLPSWEQCRGRLRGETVATEQEPAKLPPASWLPPAERRRATLGARIVSSVAQEALSQAGWDRSALPSVFASSSGSPEITDELCAMLAAGDTQISPTKFHNSVHNAAAGYYSIAVGCQAASISLGAFDGSAGSGLLEAAAQIADSGAPLLFVSFDLPYTGPLAEVRAVDRPWGIALALSPAAETAARARLSLQWEATAADATPCRDAALEHARLHNPTARLLPLLAALAGPTRDRVLLALPGGHLAIEVAPC